MRLGGPSVAVIGAGISGLACAEALEGRGCAVRVFEKSRGLGGRASTRRREGWHCDHGAQYFTVQSARFAERVADWERRGVAAIWRGRVVELRADGSHVVKSEPARYVGVPGMSRLTGDLAAGLELTRRARVDGVERSAGGRWRLRAGGDELGEFDAVVSSAPAPQSATLLREAAPAVADSCDRVVMHPCWAVLAVFPTRLDLEYDAAFVEGNPLAWISRDSSKPQRSSTPERWVMHAGPTWSAGHLEEEAADVAPTLLGEFAALAGLSESRPSYLEAHRWRYARSHEPLTEGCIVDTDSRLAVCGDWLAGDRIEGAFLSGLAAADRVADALVTD